MASYSQPGVTSGSGHGLEMFIFHSEMFLFAVTLATVMGFDLCLCPQNNPRRYVNRNSIFFKSKNSKIWLSEQGLLSVGYSS